MAEATEPSSTISESRPVVLGDFTHEGLAAKIESLGFEVINRRLRSTPANWQRITDLMHSLIGDGRLALLFAYLPTTSLMLMAEPSYDHVRPGLFAEIERTRAIFFVHEDNLQGRFEPLPWEVEDTDDAARERMDIPWRTIDVTPFRQTREDWIETHAAEIARSLALVEQLAQRKIELAPFRKRSDVTLRMFEALEEAQAGIFLRLYIPHGRYHSEQFEDFLTLFARYLRDVENKEFSIDVHRTSRGTTYVFKGRGDASTMDDLRNATKRFDAFLTLSQTDPVAASRALETAGAEASGAAFVVAKYARSIRRLHMEMRHEFERRRLLLSQSLEADLLDASEAHLLPVPSADRPSSVFAVVGNTAPVTITLSPTQIAAGGDALIERFVSGGVHYTEEDKKILSLIESLDDKVEALKLRSELDRLKDVATQPDERRTAVQKLKTFLYTGAKYARRKVDEIGTKLLVQYLEKMLTGK
mgnify:CR=1 FL=1